MKDIKTLTACLVSTSAKTTEEVAEVCLPNSLRKWKEKKHINDSSENKYKDESHVCQVEVKDLKGKTRSGRLKSMSNRVYNWDVFDKQLREEEILRKYPKVSLSSIF